MAEESKPNRSRRWSLEPGNGARPYGRPRPRGGTRDDGITLIEVMVAFLILMITMVPIGYLLTSTVRASTTARQRGGCAPASRLLDGDPVQQQLGHEPANEGRRPCITGQAQALTDVPQPAHETPVNPRLGDGTTSSLQGRTTST